MTRRSRITHDPPPEVRDALKSFGRYIREARLRRGLRIQDVADRLGISRSTIAGAEKGKPSTSVVVYVGALWALGLLDRFVGSDGAPRRVWTPKGKVLENTRAPASGSRPG